MTLRAVALIALAMLALSALASWGDDPRPLLIDGASAPVPQSQPLAGLPVQERRFTPCPVSPRQFPRKIERNA